MKRTVIIKLKAETYEALAHKAKKSGTSPAKLAVALLEESLPTKDYEESSPSLKLLNWLLRWGTMIGIALVVLAVWLKEC